MANITVYEFNQDFDEQGELHWPADKTTTVDDSATHTLQGSTRCVVLCADTNVRVSFDGNAAVTSGLPAIAAVPNFFKVQQSHRTMKFVVG